MKPLTDMDRTWMFGKERGLAGAPESENPYAQPPVRDSEKPKRLAWRAGHAAGLRQRAASLDTMRGA